MDKIQKEAVAVVVEYLREERDHYEQFVERGGRPEHHVYHHVMVLEKMLKGE
jgi:hypothetical protein